MINYIKNLFSNSHSVLYTNKLYFSSQHALNDKSILFTQNNPSFRVVTYKPNVVRFNGTEIPQHESVHMKIQNVQIGEIFAIFSSSKGEKNSLGLDLFGKKISSTKINNTFTPTLNKETKNPIMDDFGYMIPNANKGGQHALLLQKIRFVSDDLLIEDKIGTDYCKKNYGNILELYKLAKNKNLSFTRNVFKEDPSLYHENGSPIYDVKGQEID